MHRVPNPPKTPLVSAAEKRAQKGFGVRHRGAVGPVAALVMFASVGAVADECRSAVASAAASCPAAASPGIIVHGGEPARRRYSALDSMASLHIRLEGGGSHTHPRSY